MKVLMFGWEFPPFSSGGLGTACYGLTRGLAAHQVEITFIVPYSSLSEFDFLRILSTNVKVKKLDSLLRPYITSAGYTKLSRRTMNSMYGSSLFEEVSRYATEARKLARKEDFDIIHCHDWMTFKAGINAKMAKKKPLVVHIHSTEFDRTGGNGLNQQVYDIEREGMHAADAIIAVSNYTKNMIVTHYGIAPEKVKVVHNAVDTEAIPTFNVQKKHKVVLFLGRVTLQKGPDYFVEAAKRVLEYDPDVLFIVAGTGDMEHHIINRAAELGISKKILFAGFLEGDDVHKAYQMADLYVMPSVSEPFGITALEAIKSGTPVLISKQSGVSEVITHALKADFWDVEDIASKIIAALKYKTLHHTLKEHGSWEIKKFRWDEPAEKCIIIYKRLTS